MSSDISLKTKKLLEWLRVKENFDIAENIFQKNQTRYEEITFLMESEKVDFKTFIMKLIQKHEQAISG